MARAVLGVFPPETIGQLLEELAAAGVDPASLSVAVTHRDVGMLSTARLARSFRNLRELQVDGMPKLDGAGPVVERAERFGPCVQGAKAISSLVRAITREGIPEILARTYVSELEDGGAFLSARVPGGRVGKVVALMNRHTGRTIATAGDELDDEATATPPSQRITATAPVN
jgi:hypothetical protein